MTSLYHGRITCQCTCFIDRALLAMGLDPFDDGFWFGGAGRMTGRLCCKEAETTFFPESHRRLDHDSNGHNLYLRLEYISPAPSYRPTPSGGTPASAMIYKQNVVLISMKPNHDGEIEI